MKNHKESLPTIETLEGRELLSITPALLATNAPAVTVSAAATITSDAPVLQPVAESTYKALQYVSIPVTGSDPQGTALTWSATNLPTGARISSSGVLGWTPQLNQLGTWTVMVSASDGTNVTKTPVVINITSNPRYTTSVLPPKMTAISPVSASAGQTVQFKVSATDPNGKALTYSASNLPTGSTFDAKTQTFSWTPTATQTGAFYPVFTANDGTYSACRPVTINVAQAATTPPPVVNQAPVMNAIPAVAVTPGTPIQFTVSATDPNGDPLTYTASNLPTGATFNASTHAFAWTPMATQAGNYAPQFTVSDGSLTASQTASVQVASATTPPPATGGVAPVVQAVPESTCQPLQNISITLQGSDPQGTALTWSATRLPTGATFNASTQTLSWTPQSNQLGTYTVYVSASDGTNVTRVPVVINVGASSGTATSALPPTMAQIPPVTVAAGQPVQFKVSATDPSGQALTYWASSMPAGAAFDANTQTFSWTPTADQTGTYCPVFTANDGTYSATRPAAITVTQAGTVPPPAANGAPVMNAIPAVSVTTGSPVQFTVKATDPNGDALTYTASNLPTGATFNASTQVFSWTPTSTQTGAFTPQFTVSDGSLSASQTAAITVSAVAPTNVAPVMSAIPAVSVTAGSPVTFTVKATDANGDALTYTASNLPTGATFNASTQVFSWTPTTSQTGTFAPQFTVSDGKLTASQTASIQVASAVTPPPTGGGTGPTGTGNQTNMGLGGTTGTMIDPDGDGYGVGSPKGPDANPYDPTVNTYASALAKYGSTQGILNAIGYNPSRIIYVATNGSDSTGVVGDINHPFATWDGVKNLVQPGDAVIYRAGTYSSFSSNMSSNLYINGMNGTASAPIEVMGMPGEKVVLDTNGGTGAGLNITGSTYMNFDNFLIKDSVSTDASGVNFNYSSNLSFKNIETTGHLEGLKGMQDLHNITIDSIVSHDNPGEHGIYLGSRDLPDSNIVIKNSVIYNNAWNGIQLNGRVDNALLTNNIIHDNGQTGIQFIQGVSNSKVTNNVIYNNAKQGISIYMYDSTSTQILPFDMTGNVFENNTVVLDSGDSSAAILFNDATAAQTGSMANNVFRNNIIVGGSGPVFEFRQAKWADSTTIANNIIYNPAGGANTLLYGTTKYSYSSFATFEPTFQNNKLADPKFVSQSGLDFDLLSTSPAINFGTSTGAPGTDLRYDGRIGLPDAGAYEYLH